MVYSFNVDLTKPRTTLAYLSNAIFFFFHITFVFEFASLRQCQFPLENTQGACFSTFTKTGACASKLGVNSGLVFWGDTPALRSNTPTAILAPLWSVTFLHTGSSTLGQWAPCRERTSQPLGSGVSFCDLVGWKSELRNAGSDCFSGGPSTARWQDEEERHIL